jgi:hypothetical protein
MASQEITAAYNMMETSGVGPREEIMALGVLFDFPGVTSAQYDGVVNKLSGGRGLRALSDWPGKGILSHVAGPTQNGWCVFDVWESEAAFATFGPILMPLLQEFKLPQVQPQIFAAHNVIMK